MLALVSRGSRLVAAVARPADNTLQLLIRQAAKVVILAVDVPLVVALPKRLAVADARQR